jgi:hypothetical protein
MKITSRLELPHVLVGCNSASAWLFSRTSQSAGGAIRANGESVVFGDELRYLRLFSGYDNFVTISGALEVEK